MAQALASNELLKRMVISFALLLIWKLVVKQPAVSDPECSEGGP